MTLKKKKKSKRRKQGGGGIRNEVVPRADDKKEEKEKENQVNCIDVTVKVNDNTKYNNANVVNDKPVVAGLNKVTLGNPSQQVDTIEPQQVAKLNIASQYIPSKIVPASQSPNKIERTNYNSFSSCDALSKNRKDNFTRTKNLKDDQQDEVVDELETLLSGFALESDLSTEDTARKVVVPSKVKPLSLDRVHKLNSKSTTRLSPSQNRSSKLSKNSSSSRTDSRAVKIKSHDKNGDFILSLRKQRLDKQHRRRPFKDSVDNEGNGSIDDDNDDENFLQCIFKSKKKDKCVGKGIAKTLDNDEDFLKEILADDQDNNNSLNYRKGKMSSIREVEEREEEEEQEIEHDHPQHQQEEEQQKDQESGSCDDDARGIHTTSIRGDGDLNDPDTLLSTNLRENVNGDHCDYCNLNGENNGYINNERDIELGTSEEVGRGEEQEGKASLASCCLSLLNTAAGAGILGLPRAYAGSGYAVGTVLLICAASFSALGLKLLALSAKKAIMLNNDIDDNDNDNVENENENGNLPSPSSLGRMDQRQQQRNSDRRKPVANFRSVADVAFASSLSSSQHPSLFRPSSVIDLSVSLKCFGVATGYLITFADCMVDVASYLILPVQNQNEFCTGNNCDYGYNNGDTSMSGTALFLTDRKFWVILAFLMVLPLSFHQTLNDLRYASVASITFTFVLAAGVIIYAMGVLDPCPSSPAFDLNTTTEVMTVTNVDDWNYISDSSGEQLEGDCHGPTYAYTTPSQTLKRLSIFVFGFTCHQNVFVLINELRAPTVSRMDKAILISIGTAFVAYLAVAVGGYYTFGDGVSGDILLNYPKTLVVTLVSLGYVNFVCL